MPDPIDIGRIAHDARKSRGHLMRLARDWIREQGPTKQLPHTWQLDIDYRVEWARRTINAKIAARSDDQKAWWLREIERDFFVWRDNFARVYDESRGIAVPYMAWPFHAPLQALYIGLEHEGTNYLTPAGKRYPGICIKSREQGATVAIATAAVWMAFHSPFIGSQFFAARILSQVDDNSRVWENSTFAKIRRIIDYQPRWMLPMSWRRTTRKRVDVWRRIQVPERECAIFAATSDYEAARSRRAIRYFVDEANSIPRLMELYQAASDVAPVLMISSITHRSTWFARTYHGETITPVAPSAIGKKAGIVSMSMHYENNPRFSSRTKTGRQEIAERKAGKTKQQWAQEWDLNFAAADTGLIFGEFARAIHLLDERTWRDDYMPYLDDAVCIETWDFGDTANSLTVWILSYYWEETDELVVAHYRSFSSETVEVVVEEISQLVRTSLTPWATLPDYRIGDIAGKKSTRLMMGGRKIAPIHTWVGNLRKYGVHVTGIQLDPEACIAMVRHQLSRDPREHIPLQFAPGAGLRNDNSATHLCPVEAMEQYRRHMPEGSTPENYVGKLLEPSKGPPSHLSDAIQFAAYLTWRGTNVYKESSRRKTKRAGISQHDVDVAIDV